MRSLLLRSVLMLPADGAEVPTSPAPAAVTMTPDELAAFVAKAIAEDKVKEAAAAAAAKLGGNKRDQSIAAFLADAVVWNAAKKVHEYAPGFDQDAAHAFIISLENQGLPCPVRAVRAKAGQGFDVDDKGFPLTIYQGKPASLDPLHECHHGGPAPRIR